MDGGAIDREFAAESRQTHDYGLCEVRAVHDENTLVVYQAYDDAIADAALAAGTFVPPFKMGRMTWIKPSFTWMMYRSRFGTAAGQTRVLAITLTREGFAWALQHAALSTYHPSIHGSPEAWRKQIACEPVRVQWDPERSVDGRRLEQRAVQIGLQGAAVLRYAKEWICHIEDVTNLARKVGQLVAAGNVTEADALLPEETIVPMDPAVAARLGMQLSKPAQDKTDQAWTSGNPSASGPCNKPG